MEKPKTNPSGNQSYLPIIEAAIRILAIGLLLIWCFLIFRPFIPLVIWSIIIAVTAHPVFMRMTRVVKGRKGLAAGILVALAVTVILVPAVFVTGSIVRTGKTIVEGLDEGTLRVGPPNEQVKDWPLIGEEFYSVWSKASANLETTLQEYHEQVRKAVGWLFSSLAGLGVDIALTLAAFIIAGVLLVNAESGGRAANSLFLRLIGERGVEYCNAARDTIRSVVQGVVLVALIQSVLAWIGFALVGLPAAGVWAVLVLLLAVMQLPAILIMLPLIIFVFSYASTGAAIAFAVWSVVVSISDSFLKPMFLGRGLDIPMLVILIGALGGMMLHGIIGLFVGAVVLSLGYKLYVSWVDDLEKQ